MIYTPRPYQESAIAAGAAHLRHGKGNGVIVAPTGSGKSLVVAGIAHALDEPVVVFQPSVELLNQNMEKLRSYGYEPAVFSAAAGSKHIDRITLATIGSARNRASEFKRFKHVLIDECHLAHSGSTKKNDESTSMYKQFVDAVGNPRMVGLTATPWRLATNSYGSENRFLTRMQRGLWSEVIHVTQIQELAKLGFMAPLEYYFHQGMDISQLRLNSAGSEFTDASIQAAMHGYDFEARVVNMIERLLKYGRKSILVFTPFVKDAEAIASFLPGIAEAVSGTTHKTQRADIISRFKSGSLKVVTNARLLGIGFDHPALDTIILGAPTASLSRYYQEVGRGLRPHASKKSTIILDMSGNSKRFGKVEDFVITKDWKGKWCVKANGRQLTNIYQNADEQPSLRTISKTLA